MKANNTNIGPAYSDDSAHLMYIQRTGSPKQREAWKTWDAFHEVGHPQADMAWFRFRRTKATQKLRVRQTCREDVEALARRPRSRQCRASLSLVSNTIRLNPSMRKQIHEIWLPM